MLNLPLFPYHFNLHGTLREEISNSKGFRDENIGGFGVGWGGVGWGGVMADRAWN